MRGGKPRINNSRNRRQYYQVAPTPRTPSRLLNHNGRISDDWQPCQ